MCFLHAPLSRNGALLYALEHLETNQPENEPFVMQKGLLCKYNLDMLAPFSEDRHQGSRAEIQQSHPFYKVFSQHQPKHEIFHHSYALSYWHLLQPIFCEYTGLPVFKRKERHKTKM